MADRVGQRLLHDAVGGGVHPGGQRAHRAVSGDRHREAGRPGPRRQLIQPGHPGHRGQRRSPGGLVSGPQRAEHRGELAQGLAADITNGGECLMSPLRLPVHQVQRRVGLDVDHRDAVRHHVVQVPRDRQPLVTGQPGGRLGPASAVGRRPGVAGPGQLGHRQQAHQTGRQQQVELQGGAEYGHDIADHQRRDRGDPVPPKDRGEERDQQRQPRVGGAKGGCPQRYRQDHGEYRPRVTAPGQQRHTAGDQQDDREDAGPLARLAVPLMAGQGKGEVGPGREHGERGVGRPLPRRHGRPRRRHRDCDATGRPATGASSWG